MTAATHVWRGIEAQDPPWAAGDYPDLLAMAENMLATRRKRFPDMVQRGAITRQQAEAELATVEAIAAHWRWICTGEGEPAHLATLNARQAALDASLDTISQIAGDRRGFSSELALQAQHVIALRWHADLDRELGLIRNIRLTREIRARIGANSPAHQPANHPSPSVSSPSLSRDDIPSRSAA
jgi:hypothetical protein